MTLLEFIKKGNQEIGREKGRREGRVEGQIEGKTEERKNILNRIYKLAENKYSSEEILNSLIQELSE